MRINSGTARYCADSFYELKLNTKKEEEEDVDEIFKEGAKKTDIRRAVVVFFSPLSVHCTLRQRVHKLRDVLY